MSISLLKFLNENASELYFEALKLMTVESKNDPVDSPYQSYYKARETLKKLLKKLNEIIGEKDGNINREISEDINKEICTKESVVEDDADADKIQYKRLTAVIHLRLGTNQTETEELTAGEEDLEKCRLIVEADVTILSMGIKQEVLNQLGCLSSQRGEFETSLKILEAAKKLYEDFKNTTAPWSVDDFFRADSYNLQFKNEKGTEIFEDNFTHTLYFLAQVYEKMERNTDAATYCKETLGRQLDRHKYKPCDWAMNAATLSQYFTSIEDFKMARHCMAAAETILKEAGQCPSSLVVTVSEEDSQEEVECKEKESRLWADLFWCWLKYCISLLEFSRERCYAMLDGVSKEMEELTMGDEHLFNLVVASCEGQVTAERVLVFQQAREVFLKGVAWMKRVKEFYQIDGHCTDHIQLFKDHSRLLKVLAFFEEDLTRQCKMHKRRIDMLTEVLNQLNPQYYLALCCQLCFEIGEVYSSMLDNKLAITEMQQRPSPPSLQAATKINSLAKKSVEFFERYLKYLNNPQGKLPENLEEGDERPVMLAHFYIARMHSKLITGDAKEQLANSCNSYQNYNYLVEYCRSHPSCAAKVKEERAACEEMVQLLPAKMNKIRSFI